ncbi:MAG: Ldh family oxidoreductase [Betaproteobacteria bacterium]
MTDESVSVDLSLSNATDCAVRALSALGFSNEESAIISANLLDAELCGYPALGLARILTIKEHPYFAHPRTALAIEFETPVSARMDGGNYPGFYAVYRATQLAIEKARLHGFSLVSMHNSWLSGRSAYYMELITRAGLAGIHFACSAPVVAPLGGRVPALGTNPIAFGVPAEPHPLILDIGTSATNNGDVVLATRLKTLLPEGVAIDKEGHPTQDPWAALSGAILPFGGHKGFGLSVMSQAMGLMAGTMLTRGQLQDFGFLFIVFDPHLLMPKQDLMNYVTQLMSQIKNTPRQPGVDEIRLPSERAFALRAKRVAAGAGISLDARIWDQLLALGSPSVAGASH